MASATAGRIKAGAAFVEITADTLSLTNALRKAQNKLLNFGQMLKDLGSDMFILGGFASMPLVKSLDVYSKFDDKIRNLAATLSTTIDKIEPTKKLIQDLGSTTAFSATQVAQGAIDLAHIGFSVQELQYALKPTLNLVRATGEELHRLGDISKYAGAIVKIYGKGIEDFTNVTNVMAYASNESAMEIGDLAESMKMAGPYANMIGEKLEDTAAALMLMSNMGVRGSLAGTSLRNIYMAQAEAVGKLNKADQETRENAKKNLSYFTQLGIKLKDTQGNLISTTKVMQQLRQVLKNAPKDFRVQALEEQFGMRGSIGAANMVNDVEGFLEKAIEKLKELATANKNYTENIANAQEAGLGGLKRSVMAVLEAIQIAFGEGFWGIVGKYQNAVKGTAIVLLEFVKNNKQLVSTLLLGTGAFFTIGVALFAFGTMIKIYARFLGGFINTLSLLGTVLKLPYTGFKLFSNILNSFTQGIRLTAGMILVFCKNLSIISKTVFIQSKLIAALTRAWRVYSQTGVIALKSVGITAKAAWKSFQGLNLIGNLIASIAMSFSTLGIAILGIVGGIYAWERWGEAIKQSISNAFSSNKGIDDFKVRAKKAFNDIKKDGALAIKSIQQSLEIKDFAGALKTAFAGLKVVLLEAIDPFMLAWDKFKADNHGWMVQIKSFLGYYYGKIKIAALKDKHEAERAQENEYVMRDTGRVNAAGQKVYEKFYKPQKDVLDMVTPQGIPIYKYSEEGQKKLGEWTKIAFQNELRRHAEMKKLEADILKSENSDLQTPDVVGNMKKREAEIKKARAELKSKVKEANAYATQYNIWNRLTDLFKNENEQIYLEDKSSIAGQKSLNADMAKFDTIGIDQRDIALRNAIKSARDKILSITQEFDKFKEGVLTDKVVTDEEKKKFRDFTLQLGEANVRLQTLKNKLEETRQQTTEVVTQEATKQNSIGAWSYRELQQAMGKSVAEKTLEATQLGTKYLHQIKKAIERPAYLEDTKYVYAE